MSHLYQETEQMEMDAASGATGEFLGDEEEEARRKAQQSRAVNQYLLGLVRQ